MPGDQKFQVGPSLSKDSVSARGTSYFSQDSTEPFMWAFI